MSECDHRYCDHVLSGHDCDDGCEGCDCDHWDRRVRRDHDHILEKEVPLPLQSQVQEVLNKKPSEPATELTPSP